MTADVQSLLNHHSTWGEWAGSYFNTEQPWGKAPGRPERWMGFPLVCCIKCFPKPARRETLSWSIFPLCFRSEMSPSLCLVLRKGGLGRRDVPHQLTATDQPGKWGSKVGREGCVCVDSVWQGKWCVFCVERYCPLAAVPLSPAGRQPLSSHPSPDPPHRVQNGSRHFCFRFHPSGPPWRIKYLTECIFLLCLTPRSFLTTILNINSA